MNLDSPESHLEEIQAKGRLTIPLMRVNCSEWAEGSARENTLVEALDAWATSRRGSQHPSEILPDASSPMLDEFTITSKADRLFADRDGLVSDL